MGNYSELLKDPRWQKKRLQILERDGWKCTECPCSTETLHVHHLKYMPGKMPWEIEDQYLVTLCVGCHELEEYLKKWCTPLITNHARAVNLPITRIWKMIGAFTYAKLHDPELEKILTDAFNSIENQPDYITHLVKHTKYGEKIH